MICAKHEEPPPKANHLVKNASIKIHPGIGRPFCTPTLYCIRQLWYCVGCSSENETALYIHSHGPKRICACQQLKVSPPSLLLNSHNLNWSVPGSSFIRFGSSTYCGRLFVLLLAISRKSGGFTGFRCLNYWKTGIMQGSKSRTWETWSLAIASWTSNNRTDHFRFLVKHHSPGQNLAVIVIQTLSVALSVRPMMTELSPE